MTLHRGNRGAAPSTMVHEDDTRNSLIIDASLSAKRGVDALAIVMFGWTFIMLVVLAIITNFVGEHLDD